MKTNELKEQIKTRNLKAPFSASYHGDSTIIVDATGRPIWGQVDRSSAETIAKQLNQN